MTPERYKEVGEVYRAALEVDVDRRAAFLAEACGGDQALRQEVESLLGYREQRGLVDRGALEVAAQALVDDPTTVIFNQYAGHYRLLSLLGKGGMGEVYLSLDTRLNRKVAIKLLPAKFTQDADRVRRFEQEARAASALNHPNIITVYEIGEAPAESGSVHYIVTECIEGETLRQRMVSAPNNRMKITEAVDTASQVAAALTAAHEAGIAHRDIKPENVMVRRDGYVKVLDFGLAKLTDIRNAEFGTRNEESETQSQAAEDIPHSTEAGVVIGTPRYMSPEQARGEKVDARTDVFSLGVMFYEMVEGRPPFAGATTSEMIAAILRDEPPPLTLDAPPELEQIIGQALRKDRGERYQTAKALLGDLNQLKEQLLVEKFVVPPSGGSARRRTLPPEGGTTNKRRWLIKLGAALTLLLAAVAAAVYFISFGGRGQAIDSLAVLPLVNVGANPDTEYLSDGVTDGLINGLSRLPELKVMSRNAVLRYKGQETDAQQVGNTLGVRAVLTGKVTQRGDDLLISVALMDVRDNRNLWGEQYNRKLSGLLDVQAELARDISRQLRLKLGSEEQQRLTQHGTENPAAYELFLKGRHHLNSLTKDGNTKAVAYFQQALEKDPKYGAAYAGLADYYASATYIFLHPALSPKEARAKAKDAASRAVQLDDTLADAHTALAKIAMLQEWDWPTAEREFQRAIALNPNDLNARHWYSHYLVYLGRFAESLVESQRALALDPYDVSMNYHLGFHYLFARQYEPAVAQLLKALELDRNHDTTHGLLGLAYEQQGRYQEAIAELQKCKELGSLDQGGMIGHVYAVSGQRGEAEKILAQLLEETKDKHVSPYNIAKIYTGLGEQEQAFAWLEKAYAERDSNMTNLKVDQQFDRLRSDPRFTDLLRRMGIPQ